MSFFEEKSTFSGLIRYYARKLRDPHAEGEMWGFLWLAMQAQPNKPDRYYAVCLRNKFIDMLRAENKNKCADIDDYKCGSADPENELKIDLSTALHELTKLQSEVIKLHYFCGFSVAEIANSQHISRQAVNRSKNRALDELSKLLLDSSNLNG